MFHFKNFKVREISLIPGMLNQPWFCVLQVLNLRSSESLTSCGRLINATSSAGKTHFLKMKFFNDEDRLIDCVLFEA